MQLRCPQCGAFIPREDLSVEKDLARCACGFRGPFSDVLGPGEGPRGRAGGRAADGVDVPWGAWLARRGDRAIIGALNLTWIGLLLLPLSALPACAWIAAAADILARPRVTGQGWLTIAYGAFIVALIIGYALFATFGQVEVIMDDLEGTITTGLGPLKVQRRFVPIDVDGISEREHPSRRRGWSRPLCLQLHGPSGIQFGASLCHRHRQFIRSAMEAELGLVRVPGGGPSRRRST